jgi:2-aminobenzoate-CoA ligase
LLAEAHAQGGARRRVRGSPPLAFTFGLGGLLVFPLRIGASTILIERPSPDALADAVEKLKPTVLVTAPTSYRAIALGSAGTRLLEPAQVRRGRRGASRVDARACGRSAPGIDIVDGIGSTEMFHIFISHPDDDVRPGATGKPVPRLPRVRDRRRRQAAAARTGRQARGQGARPAASTWTTRARRTTCTTAGT